MSIRNIILTLKNLGYNIIEIVCKIRFMYTLESFGEWFNHNWLIILIIVLSVVAGVWITALVFALSFTHVFHKRLKKESETLNLLLKERRNTVLRYVELAKKYNIEFDKELIKGVNRLERVNDFQALSKEQRDERLFAFIKASHQIVTTCRKCEQFVGDEEFDILEGMYVDLEDAYRQKCAKYNADVLGYNYWIRIPGTRILMRILKHKQKELIV